MVSVASTACSGALVRTSKFEPGAVPLTTVASNLRPRAEGRRRASSAYRAGRSRRNSLENVSMTASLYGVMLLEPTAASETGFSSVSLTQSASASPVIIGIVMPPPGSEIPREACMMRDSFTAFAQISEEISLGRRLAAPADVWLRSMPAIIGSYSYQNLELKKSANCEPVSPLTGSPETSLNADERGA